MQPSRWNNKKKQGLFSIFCPFKNNIVCERMQFMRFKQLNFIEVIPERPLVWESGSLQIWAIL
jgi:hypothetical protein